MSDKSLCGSSRAAGLNLRMLSRSSRIRENPMLEYLVMVELACNDLQQRHKASIKNGQRLNPRCQRITCENKGYAEKRVHGTFVET